MKISALAVAFLGLASGHNIREEKAKLRRHQTKAVRGADGPNVHGKALCGEMDLRNAQCYKDSEPDIYNAAKAVIAMRSNFLCTGWLVGPNGFMLTNNHCLSSQSDADGWNFHFMYESANGSCQVGGVADSDVTSARVVSGAELVWTSSELDATLLKLPGGPDLVSEFGSYDISDQPPVVGQHIYIAQHPQGRDKSIGIIDSYTDSGFCEVGAVSSTQFDYTCDTQGGSSGSPVVDKNNPKMAIGLHFGGRPDCHGNVAKVMSEIYPHIKDWVYGGSVPTPTPPIPSPPTGSVQPPSGGVIPMLPPTGGPVQQPTGGSVQPPTGGSVHQPTGGFGQQPTAQPSGGGFVQQPTGGFVQQPTGGFVQQPTAHPSGGGFVQQPTGGFVHQPTGGCTNLFGWKDSYGDSCSFYENTPGSCEEWGDDIGTGGVTPAEACCVCK